MTDKMLNDYLREAASTVPDNPAVVDPRGHGLSYQQLYKAAKNIAGQLRANAVMPDSRVGVYLHKSVESLSAILGILEAGCAYVPVDASAPITRNSFILADCGVSAVFVDSDYAETLEKELSQSEAKISPVLIPVVSGSDLRDSTDLPNDSIEASVASSGDNLAYVLYTSGSTGKPKGVMVSHRSAIAFVEWAARTFEVSSADRISSHAPFHFDLSIFDIYLCIRSSACLVLVPEDVSKDPRSLANLIDVEQITVWYSAPSILSLLVDFGSLDKRNYDRLRLVLFAGEVFPIQKLRQLVEVFPDKRYFNLYGPTETNVCTYFEAIPPIPRDRFDPLPIGPVCDHLEAVVLDDAGKRVAVGQEGELCVRGPAVTLGYWNLESQTDVAFIRLPDGGDAWYRTGDLVTADESHCFTYRGRRDRMIKKRGYRVELGEIEVTLHRHPCIREVAVVANTDKLGDITVVAHLSCIASEKPSTIALREFCAELIPVYMQPDKYCFHDDLPKTSTDKIDYQTLKGPA